MRPSKKECGKKTKNMLISLNKEFSDSGNDTTDEVNSSDDEDIDVYSLDLNNTVMSNFIILSTRSS